MATKSQQKKKLAAPNPSIDAKSSSSKLKLNPKKLKEDRETPSAAAEAKKRKRQKASNEKPNPNKLKEDRETPTEESGAKKQKASNEIDEIFQATAKQVADDQVADGGNKGRVEGTSKKSRPESGSKKSRGKGTVPDDEVVKEKRPRRRTNDGLTIYSAEELGFGKADAGGTALCPFDCTCCF